MSGFSFAGSKEAVSSSDYLKAGIHDFEILDFYYQPAGDSVKGVAKKDGSLVSYKTNNLMLVVKCIKTHKGNNSANVEGTIAIQEPKVLGDGKDKGRIDRVFHALCNIATKEKKDSFKAQLESAKFLSFGDVAVKLASVLKGRTVRYKLAASDGKGAYLPSYFGGFAETTDTPFAETTLKFEVGGSEDIKVKSNTEEMPQLGGEVMDFSATSDVPFDLGSGDDELF
jgi:hypothetical protein